MSGVDAVTESYSKRSGLDELRSDAFPFVAVSVVVIPWLAAQPLLLVESEAALGLPLVAGMLGLGILTLASYRLLARSIRAASALLVGGLVAATAALLLIYPSAPVAYAFSPIVLIAGLLLGPGWGVVVAALASGVLLAAWTGGAIITSLGAAEMVMALIWTTAVLVWQASRPVYTALDWAYQSYAQSLRNVQELRVRQGELNRALKQLDDACYRQERANIALGEAWRRANEAEHFKAEFVSNIAHELRTPLNLIAGFSELMLSSPDSYGNVCLTPAHRGDINAIHRAAQHLLGLVEGLFDVTQARVSRLTLVREMVDLGELIREVVDLFHEYLAAKGLECQVDVDPSLPPVSLDRLRIRQVLLNLLTNAIRFTDHGGIAVAATPGNGSVLVRVRDTGRGIASQELAHIFDEFESVGPPTKMGGMGLGLPISKQLVELHGGCMGVESQLRAGTTFWFSVPLADRSRPDARSPRRVTPALVPPEKVIVVADADPAIRRALQRGVEGYQVCSAKTPTEAWSLGLDLRATAVVASVATPLPDPRRFPVPVVRMAFPSCRRVADFLGVADFLAKPVSRQNLFEVITRANPRARRVLVGDDDAEFVRLVRRMLATDGRFESISVAYTGEEVLRMAHDTVPDLILLDLSFPDVDGTQVIAELSDDAVCATIPVLVISARAFGEEITPSGEFTLSHPDNLGWSDSLAMLAALLGTIPMPRAYSTTRAVAIRRG
ncbi:MAG: response regulator [Chloroflexi bacterium]|nr:response regulator [Chloroflexota bacterium]